MNHKAFITGLSGPLLQANERALLKEARPCGVIFFDRNIENPEQLRRLVGDYLEAVGTDRQLVLIDQEGGRIQRMRAPHWRVWPAAERYGKLYRSDRPAALLAARLVYRMMTDELRDVGINTNCVPLLDVPTPGAHSVIGDRALSDELHAIVELGRAVADGNLQGAVLPVIKHMPGHGRATADSHVSLPVIDAPRAELQARDFVTFKALNDLPLGMTGHLLLTDIDPTRNASVSPTVIEEVIRGFIGFDGLLMSDDLHMEALDGGIAERARDVVAAGCDLALYCKGVFEDIAAVADIVPDLQGAAARRFDEALELIKPPQPFDREQAEQLIARLPV